MKIFKYSLGIATLFFFGCYASNLVLAQEPEIKLFPDFTQISLSDFGTIEEDGAIGTEYNQLARYDVSRQFSAGDRPEQFLKLGDLEASLAPQKLTLDDIVRTSKASIDLTTVPLSEFSLVERQTIEDLVEAVPDLGSENASDVAPIASVLEQAGFGDATNSDLENIINDEEIAALELGDIDLSQFSVDSIPHLEQAPLENFADYQASFVAEVPGLAQVPLSEFPNAVEPNRTFIARIDLVWGKAESARQRTISGSYVDGFSVPCQSHCEHLELDDLENSGVSIQSPFEGKQWIAGRENLVNGGTGCFAGGREPTGIHPFGDIFKSVLWRADEATDTAEVVIFFNLQTSCGESPYFIGPIPFPSGQVKINDYIFISAYGGKAEGRGQRAEG